MIAEENLEGFQTQITISRCKYKENLDTCEHFYDHKVNDYCEMIQSKNTLWSPLFGSYVPEYKCPIKKGLYRSVNSTLDVSAMLLFPIDAWYWRVRVEVKDKATGRMVTCMIVETRIASTS
ncbi:hypothetical protein ILUMI_09240 [Ignelater luminosus]|uniref:MD-2-related lipid-recognition domain-containing protein n=1 Tax=Ignelater luminosus TaxID=2038154 RepID=A0A8K0D491_IGNLU|nr:hypothetical protein ILUMI_09240 [Ignelater luminosus]